MAARLEGSASWTRSTAAKAMAGLIVHMRSGLIPGSRGLLIRTDGHPATFAYGDKLGSCLSNAPAASGR